MNEETLASRRNAFIRERLCAREVEELYDSAAPIPEPFGSLKTLPHERELLCSQHVASLV